VRRHMSEQVIKIIEPSATEDLMNETVRKRPVQTRRIRLNLAAWHLKCALTHLWKVLRGGR